MIMFAYLAGMTRRIEFVTGILILPQRRPCSWPNRRRTSTCCRANGCGWESARAGTTSSTRRWGRTSRPAARAWTNRSTFLRKLWSEPLLTFEGRFDRITRANLNIRPRRQIPIWMGGFAEPAYRRAIRMGDGFIFATVAHADLETAWAAPANCSPRPDGPEATFGRDYIALRTAGVEDAADRLKRWRDSGGTHGTISPLDQGFADIQQHIDFVGEVLGRLR